MHICHCRETHIMTPLNVKCRMYENERKNECRSLRGLATIFCGEEKAKLAAPL